MVEEAYSKAKELLTSHREQLDELASQLYDKEVLFREDLERIYGPRPWEDKKALPETGAPSSLPENNYNESNTNTTEI